MPNFVILSLIFAVGRAIVTVIQKTISHGLVTDWKVFTFIFYFSGIVLSAFLYLLSPYPISLQTVITVMPSVTFFFAGGVGFYYALFHADVSIIGGLQSLKLVFVAIFSFLLLQEQFSSLTYLLIAVLVISSLLVIAEEKMRVQSIFNLPLLVNFVSLAFFALSDVFAKKAMGSLSSTSFFSAELALSAVFSLILLPYIFVKKPKITTHGILQISINAWMTFGVALSLLAAFQTNVTISNAIGNLTGPCVLVILVILERLQIVSLEKYPPKIFWIRFIGVVISYLAALGILFTL